MFRYILTLAILLFAAFFSSSRAEDSSGFSQRPKKIYLNDDGIVSEIRQEDSSTVGDLVKKADLKLEEGDWLFPDQRSRLNFGQTVFVRRAKKILLEDKKEKTEKFFYGREVGNFIDENNIQLGEDDILSPGRNQVIASGSKIKITRVEIKEEIAFKDVDFKKEVKEDDSLSWRTVKITQKGEKGKDELKYRVVYHDGKELSRKLLDKQRIKEPVVQIETQGTFMKLAKGKTGQASHYAASWGALNASRDIPRGGYAKVTNLENGKSVVVKINDYGPQSPERVIDLDYVSFTKLANSWQGIIHKVKVERVLN